MAKKQAEDTNKADHRTFLSLHHVGPKLTAYANTDPRFSDRSAAARHLIEKGLKADKKDRAKAMDAVKV